MWIFQSMRERDQRLAFLKCLPCPHCKLTGALNRHGFLRGYDQQNQKQKDVRATRVFCSNRGNAQGCGKTFSVWVADKVRRLFLDAAQLWEFLWSAADTGNRKNAFEKLNASMSPSAPYRIWKRFLKAQSAIRTQLSALRRPAKQVQPDEGQPDQSMRDDQAAAWATLQHLAEAFPETDANPIAAFQHATGRFFL